MVNAGHKVRVRMTATLDDGTDLDIGFGDGGETEITLGAGDLSSYVESLVECMDVGEARSWNTPAVRVLGPKMIGRDVRYEVTLLADYGRVVSAVAAEHIHHEHGCSCGCDRLRRSLAQA